MTLIIYDTTGKIYSQVTGEYILPDGIPYLEIDVPEGKYIESVDTSVTPNIPIYEDVPTCTLDTIQTQVTAINIALAEILGGGADA